MAAPSPMPAVELSPKEKHAMLDRPKSITFKGKLFYLDLPHNKSTQFLTKAICRLGGVIEGFLSRDVNYVVTGSRKALDNVNGSSVISRKGGHCKRQAAENVEPALCRGKQLLKKAIQNQERSNVLANAHSWGVCILQVDEVLKHLEHFTHSASKTAVEKGAAGAKGVKTIKVAKLKCPFLKIEDQSRKYRPLQCCFSSFPEISFISSGRSPFETAHTNNSTPKEKDAGDQDDGERSQRPHTREKSGFCECCRVAYTKLSEHLISEQHSQFALDNSNYKVIDDIASNVCDLMEYPWGIMPVMEGVVADGPFNIEDTQVTVLKEESKMVVPEVLCEGNSAVNPVEENCAAHVSEEHMLDIVQRQPVKYASHSEREENMDVTKNDGDPVECNGQIHPFAEDANNILIQCKGQLPEICGAEVASHVDLVTEVSWYTEEAGLTSVYTVQSLVIPPDGQHAQITMANAVATFSPPLLLSPLADQHGDLGPECPCEAHSPSVLQDSLPGTQVTNNAGAHCSELLVEQMSVLEVGEQLQGIAEPSAGNLCGVNLLDAFVQLPAGERRPEEMVNVQLGSIRLHEQLLSVDQNDPLLNASASLHTPVDRGLCQGHLNVIPLYEGPADTLVVNPPSSTLLTNNSDREDQLVHGLVDTSAVPHGTIPSGNEASAPEQTLDVMTLSHLPAEVVHNTTLLDKASAPQNNRLNVMPLYQGSAVTHSPRPLVNEASTPEQSELQSTTDFCRGKRKHSCSSPPPAKRRSYQCKPLSLPAWAFHQLPNSGLEHVANDLPNLKKSDKKFVTNEDTVNSLNPYFNPKLIQYNASSESDWDSGLLSQQQCKHQQGAQLGDLRTAQVNLDESWYGRELGSVLAQDQSLGSHSNTQTVTLAHTSYDLYLSGFAS